VVSVATGDSFRAQYDAAKLHSKASLVLVLPAAAAVWIVCMSKTRLREIRISDSQPEIDWTMYSVSLQFVCV